MTDWVQGTLIEKRQWNETHYSLRIDAEIGAFQAGQFTRVALDIGGERIARPYSFVNPPHESTIEIFFNIIPAGPLSGRLAALDPGDPVWLASKSGGVMTLERIPDNVRDLWLIATGTAVGPFLSMLQTDDPWQRFDKVVLAYAVRYRADLAYQDAIDDLLSRHPERFAYVPHVSREHTDFAVYGRVTSALQDGTLEQRAGRDIHPTRSHVMLCGNAEMIQDATAILAERGMRRHLHRAPGHISTEKYH